MNPQQEASRKHKEIALCFSATLQGADRLKLPSEELSLHTGALNKKIPNKSLQVLRVQDIAGLRGPHFSY